jgi:hypothetical protein
VSDIGETTSLDKEHFHVPFVTMLVPKLHCQEQGQC